MPCALAGVERSAQLIHLAGRLGEVGIDGIELLNRCEACRVVLHDQRAFADIGRADDTVDRRADGGVIEIEPGAGHVGRTSGNVGFRLSQRSDRLLVLRLGRRLLPVQGADAIGVRGRLLEHGPNRLAPPKRRGQEDSAGF